MTLKNQLRPVLFGCDIKREISRAGVPTIIATRPDSAPSPIYSRDDSTDLSGIQDTPIRVDGYGVELKTHE
jgi:hypothetical protein